MNVNALAVNELHGNERFRIVRRLGAGSFGVVYEVEDLERRAHVALKLLHRPDGANLIRFKREFRALADLKHENLVGLHELSSHEGSWFFTMDLVDGRDFVSFVWDTTTSFAHGHAEHAVPIESLDADATLPAPRRKVPDLDFERLRVALTKLACGVAALHDAGKVHRDIKPSNVLATNDGKLVVLDFGLVTDSADTRETLERIVGTPAYMAPEQGAGEGVTSASDWYSVGVILYLTLTGRLPIAGSVMEMLARKLVEVPARPRELNPSTPEDLDALAMDLLQRDPLARPDDAEVLRRLGALGARAAPVASAADVPFVGRERELSDLASAYRSMRDGRTVMVSVRGPSGIGKTALVRRFLEQAQRADKNVVVLEGRCYERESVPYKALDSLVDALARYMARLPAEEAAAILPRNITSLARVFPVFDEVARASGERRLVVDIPDNRELRRRAFGALRDLLARLADRRHLILFIDDLQWGDVDSAALLVDLLGPPDPPALLLALCFRSEHVETSSLLKQLREMDTGAKFDARDVVVDALPEAEARSLVADLLAERRERDVEEITREGRGNPFFLGELVSYLRDAGPDQRLAESANDTSEGSGIRLLDGLVRARVARLSPAARALLGIVAVSGKPIERGIARIAAHLEEGDHEALELLRVGRLVRSRRQGDLELLDTDHDRIRESMVASFSREELVEQHRQVARALETAPDADPEQLAMHLHAAGDEARALSYMERAADRAAHALAFDRAVELYRGALGIDSSLRLRAKLAEALANAGYGLEAARAYLAAAQGAGAEEALELKRGAVEQFLRSGHIDEGLPVVDDVLRAVDMVVPSSPGRALASLLLQRTRLWFRGLDYKERTEGVSRDVLTRIDVCWSLGNGLGGVDLVRGGDFQARHLLQALDAGEPYRIARALAWEAIISAVEGGTSGSARAAQIAPKAMEIAQRIQHPHALAWATAAEAIAAWCNGMWRNARRLSDETIALFQERCANIGWEVGSMEFWWRLPALGFLGDVTALSPRAVSCEREAQDRGDAYTAAGVRTYSKALVWLAADKPEEARRDADDAIAEWGQSRWLTHHWCRALTAAKSHLYEGDPERGLAVLREAAPKIDESLQKRVQQIRIQTFELRARCHLAMARRDASVRDEHVREAARDAGRLDKENLAWAGAYAAGVRAGLASVRGGSSDPAIRALYMQAHAAFMALDMALDAAAMQRRAGELEGGDAGRAKLEEAAAWMTGQRIKNAEKMTAYLAPR